MWKKLLIIIAVVMPLFPLTAGNIAYAADFAACVGLETCVAQGAYNPRTANGLVAVESASLDYDYTQTWQDEGPYYHNYHVLGSTGAAAYGSDSSVDGGLNPRLLGYSVEPMADTMASISLSNGSYLLDILPISFSAYAQSFAEVNHRVVARAYPDSLKPILDSLLDIPVRLDYNLTATTTNPYGVNWSSADASFFISKDTVTIFGQGACTYFPSYACDTNHVSGTWSGLLTRSTNDQIAVYTIRAQARSMARATASNGGSDSEEAQAVADPFLYVDPMWEYAQYFTVQQESLLHPGAWADVTRQWQNTVVPIPPAVWLFGSGLLGLISIACRKAV